MSETITIPPDFASWRERARELVSSGVPPGEVFWNDASLGQGDLFAEPEVPEPDSRVGEARGESAIRVPKPFLDLAASVACHSDPERWAVLYRLLWRMTREGERHLLVVATDPDVGRAMSWAKEVGRDIHKMRAFVRFRKVGQTEAGREQFVAWFEPQHHIVRRNAPFFRKRFTGMDWSIFTPDECVHWDGRSLTFSPGADRTQAPDGDVLEELWKSYYRSIFNPARLKGKAMQAEMPIKYWKNLPEAPLIRELTQQASRRREEMIARPGLSPRKPPRNSYLENLRERNEVATVSESGTAAGSETLAGMESLAECCRACPLWERATQTVFGEGPENAEIMLVGEQPGDREDLEGRPFVGPAGELLNASLAELGIRREDLYLTNAVKHFKWKPASHGVNGVNHRGTTRLHDRASREEVGACRPWLWGEIARVAPRVIVTLGNTAGQSLCGDRFRVLRDRGPIRPSPDLPFEGRVFATVHPSYLLRLPAHRKRGERESFLEDLRMAVALAQDS